jgi:uncharacterized protein with HEPN domain
MQRRERILLEKMRDEAKYLVALTARITQDEFVKSEEYKRIATMTLINIGELSINITEGYKRNYPQIEWSNIKKTRDKVAHHYIELDPLITWDTAINDIPVLLEQIEQILDSER